MDMKLKVILFIFGIIMLLYFVYYIVAMTNSLQNKSKKENFVDMRVEEFSEKSSYDVRILILNAIEHNNIDDKQKRLDISTEMFLEVDKYKDMSQEELNDVVKSKIKGESFQDAKPPVIMTTQPPSGPSLPPPAAPKPPVSTSNVPVVMSPSASNAPRPSTPPSASNVPHPSATPSGSNVPHPSTNTTHPQPHATPSNSAVSTFNMGKLQKDISELQNKVNDIKKYVMPQTVQKFVENFEQDQQSQPVEKAYQLDSFLVSGIENVKVFAPYLI